MRVRIRVEGIVQGVGFRPFVHGLATRLGLGGFVGNDGQGVFCEVEGPAEAVDRFRDGLARRAPPLAVIAGISSEPLAERGERAFTIAPSRPGRPGGERQALISPDVATCDDCLAELSDPADRRYRYPFVNCVNCGPRFTIVRDVPYDRPNTTMADFAMCADCAREYQDPADRRFHAQPTCCPACGPALWLTGPDGTPVAEDDPLGAAAALIRDGAVVAVKGIGGYHLAADARNEDAVATLRSRKHREDKPFALLVADLPAAAELVELDGAGRDLLTDHRRPIVMLPRRDGGRRVVAAAVAPGNRYLGLMLPYSPLHHLLIGAVAGPMVLTSGNVSDEPIAYTDTDATDRLAPIADRTLGHDRPIHTRTDDSVTRPFRGRVLMLRRSRGYAPAPLPLPRPARRPLLACGAELKNTFCLAKDSRAVVSPHIGDLENVATLRSFTEGIEHLGRLFDIAPEVVAYDLHPEYLSTKYALDLPGVDRLGVQHHHAHIASCLADNGECGPVIGVAFDGTGYGTDGTLWGGEILRADLTGFTRLGHLAPVPLPGGAQAIREPWRMAAVYLDAAGIAAGDRPVARRNAARWDPVLRMAATGLNAPLTSSAGRLFDAVAALAGVRDRINYEGQAAIELEQLADRSERGAYPASLTPGEPFRINGADLVAAAAADLDGGAAPAVVAARFHHGVAAVVEVACVRARERTGLDTVALSGGVFQNLMLLESAVDRLERCGFRVLTHHRVPPNDGGVSLGQAAIAAASAAASD